MPTNLCHPTTKSFFFHLHLSSTSTAPYLFPPPFFTFLPIIISFFPFNTFSVFCFLLLVGKVGQQYELPRILPCSENGCRSCLLLFPFSKNYGRQQRHSSGILISFHPHPLRIGSAQPILCSETCAAGLGLSPARLLCIKLEILFRMVI